MILEDFVKQFICKNTIIRLWYPCHRGHEMICEDLEDEICMEWQLLGGFCWQSKYLDCRVIGVTDIVVEDSYPEAVNIVLNPADIDV